LPSTLEGKRGWIGFSMLLGLFTLITAFLSASKGKRKAVVSTSCSAPKAKRVKVFTRRSKTIGTTDVPKLIERVEVAPLATETASVISIEASADPVKELESKKAAEKPMVLSPAAITELSKPSSTIIATPRKRRMTSVLDAILESVKAPTSVSAETSGKTSGDTKEATIVSMTNVLAEAGPSEAALIGLVEENAPKKI
jgi:ATP-dependent exoDNAse (exonuclease V) beta subunit